MSSSAHLVHHPEFKDIFQVHFDENLKQGKTRAQAAAEALLQAKEAVERIIAANNSNNSSMNQSISPSLSRNNKDNLIISPVNITIRSDNMDVSAITVETVGVSPIYPSDNSIVSSDTGNRGYNAYLNASRTTMTSDDTWTNRDDLDESIRHISSSSMNLQEEYDDYTLASENIEEHEESKAEVDPATDGITSTNESFEMDDVYQNQSGASYNNNPAAETALRMDQIYVEEEAYTYGDNPSFIAPSATPRNAVHQHYTGISEESLTYEDNPSFLLNRSLEINTGVADASFVRRDVSIVSDSTASPTSREPPVYREEPQNEDEEAAIQSMHEIVLDFKVDKPSDQYLEKLENRNEDVEKVIDIIGESPSKDKDVINESTMFASPILEEWFHTDTEDVSISMESPNGEEWSAIMSAARIRMGFLAESHQPLVDNGTTPESTCFCM
jgi:hypothetical protein